MLCECLARSFENMGCMYEPVKVPLPDNAADRHSANTAENTPRPKPKRDYEDEEPVCSRLEVIRVAPLWWGLVIAEEEEPENDGEKGDADEGKGEKKGRGEDE